MADGSPLLAARPFFSREEDMSKKKDKGRSFKLKKVSERKNPPAIGIGARVATVVETAAACAIWLVASFALFEKTDLLSMALLAGAYFLCAISMYLLRAVLESSRRYGRHDPDAVFYYTQMVKSDQKWSLWIALSFFAVFTVLGWLFPSPNLDMAAINIATSFYLGFIWTSAYKGEERVPFQYMETVFLFLTVVTNYIVYFA